MKKENSNLYNQIKQLRNKCLIALLSLTITIVPFIASFFVTGNPNGVILCVFAVVAPLVIIDYFYKLTYKQKVVPWLIESINVSAKYLPDNKIKTLKLNEAKFLPSYNRFSANHLLEVNWFDRAVKLCNIRLETRTRSKHGSSTIVEFDGCVVHYNLKSPSDYKLLVRRKSRDLTHGFIQRFFSKEFEKVNVIAPKLNKKVNVWTNDQIECRKLLKPVFLEKLENLTEKNLILVSIIGDELYIAIDSMKLDLTPRSFIFSPRDLTKKSELFKQSLDRISNVLNQLNIV